MTCKEFLASLSSACLCRASAPHLISEAPRAVLSKLFFILQMGRPAGSPSRQPLSQGLGMSPALFSGRNPKPLPLTWPFIPCSPSLWNATSSRGSHGQTQQLRARRQDRAGGYHPLGLVGLHRQPEAGPEQTPGSWPGDELWLLGQLDRGLQRAGPARWKELSFCIRA